MKSKNINRVAYAKTVLDLEAKAISALGNGLTEDFEHAVSLVLSMADTGHVIVSGMGKAGFIGMKISATLSSTGVPSFFLHPAEAVHGDLGRYKKTDLALILSNSGETEEIVRIIPQIKSIACPIVSITANKSSTLGKYSDITLEIGSIEEACPLGLAPTASTTAMLALGDALAMTILKEQNFSREQFARYHPGGNLGRSLMKVDEVMRRDHEHCLVPESMPARQVLQAITSTVGRPGACSIVDSEGKLVGIFTDGNLRRCLAQGADFLDVSISEVMTRNPRVIDSGKLAADALQLLSEYKIDQIIVVNSELKPIGMIDIQDLLSFKT